MRETVWNAIGQRFIDEWHADVEKHGNPPETHRVVAINKGFELQLPKLYHSGWKYERECWSSTMADLRVMAKLRGLNI